MTPEHTDRLARLLADARTTREALVIDRLPPELIPPTIEAAYAVQRATRTLLPAAIAGWKIGATSAGIMQRFGISEPMYGAVLAGDVIQSPARIPASRFRFHVIETEFAYRIGTDLPPRPAPWTRAELLAAVDAVLPVFELISPRFDRLPFDRVTLAVADCGLNGGLVVGRPVTDWRGLDLVRQAVCLTVGGALAGEGTGADALGDPANVLEWVANRLRLEGIGLARGQLVSTGTCTGVVTLAAGDTAIGDLGPLGRVELSFTEGDA